MKIQVRPGKVRDVDFDYIDKEMKYTEKELLKYEEVLDTKMEELARKEVIKKRDEFYNLYLKDADKRFNKKKEQEKTNRIIEPNA